MKKLLLILLCLPMIGFGQVIITSSKDSIIPIMQNPSLDAELIIGMPNNITVGYSGEWEEDWIKINYFTPTGHLSGYYTEGWINCSYLNASNFKSKILEPIDLRNDIISSQIGRGIPLIENVDGIIFVEGFDDVIVKINGKYNFLERKEKHTDSKIFTEYYNDDLNIKIFDIISKAGYESNYYEGFMIINYKGIEELIFTSMRL